VENKKAPFEQMLEELKAGDISEVAKQKLKKECDKIR